VERLLQSSGVQVMASDDPGERIDRELCGRKYPEPSPILACVGIFPDQGLRKRDSCHGFSAVTVKQPTYLPKVNAEPGGGRGRQQGLAVLVTFPASNGYAVPGEIDILDPQTEAFTKS